MDIKFNGFDSQEITVKTSSAVLTKRAVAFQSTGDVYYANAGEEFSGIVTSVRNGIASIVMRGHAVASYRDTAPTVGICKLSVGPMGQLQVDEENGKPYTVFSVDTSNKTLEFYL